MVHHSNALLKSAVSQGLASVIISHRSYSYYWFEKVVGAREEKLSQLKSVSHHSQVKLQGLIHKSVM